MELADCWETKPLGDVVTFQRGFDLPYRSRVPGSAPVVSSAGITDFHASHIVQAPGGIRFELTPSLAIGTDNPAFAGLNVLEPALCCVRLVCSWMASGAKQLDIFRLLAFQGTMWTWCSAMKHFLAHNAGTVFRAAQ